MKNVKLLSKAELKKVRGGIEPGDVCKFVVTYDDKHVVTDIRYMHGGSQGANDLCVALIVDPTVGIKGCRYDCAGDGMGR